MLLMMVFTPIILDGFLHQDLPLYGQSNTYSSETLI